MSSKDLHSAPVDRYETFLLEEWHRRHHFAVKTSLASSGVAPYTLAEAAALAGISWSELGTTLLDDSEPLGAPGLRAALARRNGGGGDASQVMVTNGSSEAIFLLLQATVRAGDEVVVVDPCFQAYRSIAKTLGATVLPWRLAAEEGFRPNVAALDAILSPRTRLIVVNFPNNPTGAILDETSVAQVVALARAAGALLVWDDAFGELAIGEPLARPVQEEHVVTIGTLSKSCGLPGLRLGWLTGPPKLLNACQRVRDYTTLNGSPLIERIAERCVDQLEALVEPRLAQARANLAVLRGWAEEERVLVDWLEPRGGVTVFPRLKIKGDVDLFCEMLARDHGVFVLPGSTFGHADRVRIGFGGASVPFQAGLVVLGRALRAVGGC